MNARGSPEVLSHGDEDPRCGDPPREATNAACWVWHSAYGPIRIEVIGDSVFVDGDCVEPHVP